MPTESSPFPELATSPLLDEVTPGQVLGRYELLLPIAKGGMAMVWAARLKGTRGFQKMVAIKTMLPAMIDEPKFERMFLDEASLASGVRHPNVVEILDLGEQDHVLYLVMEWVDGEPLNIVMRYAEQSGGVPLPIAVHLVCQACKGLHAAHELRDEEGRLVGLVHRDVSPQNVLVTYSGVVKIVDFGVARATARTSAETEHGHLRGKIAYMSPEQLRGEGVDRRTDVFALGILLYMLTTGQHPLRGDDQAATIRNIGSDREVQPPSSLAPDYPLRLEAVVLRALEKDPNRRFATANEMLKALSEALPQAMRATDDEVRAFMHAILPDRLEKRRRAIKEALRSADRPSDPPALDSSPDGSPRPLESATTSAAFHDFLGAPRVSAVPLLQPRSATKDEDLLSESTDASEPPFSRPRWLMRAAVVAALALGTGALLMVFLSESERPERSSLPSENDSAATRSGVSEGPATGLGSDAGENPGDAGTHPPGTTPPADPAKAPRKHQRSPKPGSREFVSPIRDPGF